MKKLLLLFFALCVIILVTFELFGETFDQWFSRQESRELFRAYGPWAGPIGAGLLISDLLLPIPTTIIIGAMGAVMGVTAAAFWGWIGLSLAGLAGYGIARLGGQKWADKLASPDEQIRTRSLFDSWGGLAVILSRMLPVLPEAISVLAGLYGMRFSRFFIAVTLGSIPPAFAFAWLGNQAKENPGPALWGMVAITAIAWIIYIRCAKRNAK
jgi:uncharacterized membrane protein YdjX (TVP38/TMEM64 family)